MEEERKEGGGSHCPHRGSKNGRGPHSETACQPQIRKSHHRGWDVLACPVLLVLHIHRVVRPMGSCWLESCPAGIMSRCPTVAASHRFWDKTTAVLTVWFWMSTNLDIWAWGRLSTLGLASCAQAKLKLEDVHDVLTLHAYSTPEHFDLDCRPSTYCGQFLCSLPFQRSKSTVHCPVYLGARVGSDVCVLACLPAVQTLAVGSRGAPNLLPSSRRLPS